MEGPVEFIKKYQKMNEHMFDHLDAKNMDLVYGNFNLILKDTIAMLEWSETLNSDSLNLQIIRDDIESYKVDCKLLKTFFRGMLKWCIIEEGIGMINTTTSLVDILKGIESYLVSTTEVLVSCPRELEYNLLNNREDMMWRIAKSYLIVLTVTSYSSPPNPFMSIISKFESVVELIDQVLENFNYARYHKEEANELGENLSFLRNFLKVTKDWINPEKEHELLVCVETVVDKIACYSYLTFHGYKLEELYIETDSKRLESEMRIVILKASAMQQDSTPPLLTHEVLLGYVDCVRKNLIELLLDEVVHPVKVQFETLRDELTFLESLVISYTSKDDAERQMLLDVRGHVEVVARNIGSFVYQLLVEKGKMMMTEETSLGLTELVEKVNFIKAQVMDIIFLIHFNRFGRKFPQIDRLGFLKFLIDNLKEYLMNYRTDLIMEWKDQFQIILEDLIMFRFFLQKFTNNNNNSIVDADELEDLSSRINNSTYEVDCLINSFYAGVCPVWFKSVWISNIIEQMKRIKTDVLQIIGIKSIDNKINIVVSKDLESQDLAFQSVLLTNTDVMIGFENEMKLIKERLTSVLKELDVVSIIGMPGLGKTTLAKKVYEDSLIVSHFQLRAWCCVSQQYNKKDILLNILGSILKFDDLTSTKSAEELSVILHKQLMGRRYLIFVDDVWNIKDWDDLRSSFPENNIGSRILLTSRNKVIGSQAKRHTDPLELRFLTDDESWDLLEAKVFHNKLCPVEFLHVGKQIVKKCKGLPLGVVVVAGLLPESEEELGFWKHVEENLSSHISSDSQGQLLEVLELSYKFLPNYLRPLFLYLGAFPEDKEVSADNLIWLWIAEGFVQKSTELKSLEVEAREHLMDLIDRSLVMVAERSSNGSVKTCRVHDLLHDFCLRRSKKDSFLQQIHVYDELADPITIQWRLSMCLKRRDSYAPSPSVTPPLHSFLFFNLNKNLPLWNEAVKSVFCISKLLKVLHLESTTINDDLNSDMMMMVHLRYISVRVSWVAIPSSIFSFWKLETLIIKGVRGEITVPALIWTMVKLRHLHINDRARFNYDVDDASENFSSRLENLETLSTPAFYQDHEKMLITRLPNLRKLRCIFFDPGNYNQFPKLKSFDKLESVKVIYNGIERSSSPLSLPFSLKKLTLSKFRLKWNDISRLQELPNLEVLKLGFGSVIGEVWDTEDVEFPNLKFLKLESLNIKTWSAFPENFPSLEKLVLERCRQLIDIPDSLGEFFSLKKIELLGCSCSAAKLAKQIQDDQKDAGNELLKVHVYSPDLDL